MTNQADNPGASPLAFAAMRGAIQYGRTVKIALDGDSRSAASHSPQTSAGGTAMRLPMLGYYYWLEQITGCRVYCPPAYNFGVSGETTTQILARLDATLAACPDADVIICRGGVNDVPSGTVATTIANIQAYARRVVNAGKRLIYVQELPKGTLGQVDQNRNEYTSKLRRAIAALASADNVAVVDAFPLVLNDPTIALPNVSTTYFYDGIHEQPSGAKITAQLIADVINTWFPGTSPLPWSNGFRYSATDRGGNLLSNSLMSGSGGTLQNSITGTVPTGWIARRIDSATGWTVECGVEAASDGYGNWCYLQATAVGTPSGQFWGQLVSANMVSSLQVGDVLTAVGETDTVTGEQYMQEASVMLNVNFGGGDLYNYAGLGASGRPMPTSGVLGPNRVPPFTLATVPNYAYLVGNLVAPAAAGAVVKARWRNMGAFIGNAA